MIAAIEGTVVMTGERSIILETAGGVSYRVFASPETLRKIPRKSQKINPAPRLGTGPSAPVRVKLWTHLYQREDTAELYGFLEFAEMEFFETLIAIQGIGPKSGLGIMAVASLDTLKQAIAAGDTSYLTKVSGIGRKTAEKIILELRDKMAGRGVIMSAPKLKEESDALDALVTLGYSQSEARDALAAIPQGVEGASARVKAALKNLGKSPERA
ncbi:Holliday junction branch migration protein RuvA [Candidatus Parcubacteria bacterium]|nr:MAG: Holliday junction branch migration protein RuvA [Candidatus Parcubacteria bacterium]